MKPSQRYSRAPIIEAIIDFHAELPDGVTLSDLERCRTGREELFPISKKMKAAMGQIKVGEEVSASASARQIGFVFASADEKRLFRAHLNGFAVNHLAPYPGWESFRDEARNLWDAYRQAVSPRKVTRLAVRYINRLDLPHPSVELKEYLRTSPEVSPDISQPLAGFFMRLNIPQEEIASLLVLNETVVEPRFPNTTSVVLDIDLFRTTEVPQTEDGIWSFFEVLHARKNEIFEACITNKTRELIR